MAIRKTKPTSPGRRFATYQVREQITATEPERKLTEGLTNAGIAARLHLSEGTVKNYVSEILSKLHANDRTHAVVLALRHGLIDL